MVKKIDNCPQCGEKDEVIEIFYGMPLPDAFILADEGKLKIGGCCICTGESPAYYCKGCDQEFGVYTGF